MVIVGVLLIIMSLVFTINFRRLAQSQYEWDRKSLPKMSIGSEAACRGAMLAIGIIAGLLGLVCLFG